MLTHTITLSFSLSTTFNSLWKRQVQTLIEPEPDLAPALSVRPAVLSNPLGSMSSQPGSQQAGSQASSQSTRLHPAGRRGLRLSPSPRYSRASLGSLGRPQRGIAQCQALSLHHWCRMCWRQDGEGTPKACLTSTHFALTAPAKTTFSPSTPPFFQHPPQRLHPYWTLAPLPSSFPPPPPVLPSSPRSIHLGATLIQVSLFSILHPPSPSRSPANHSFLLIYWLLSACGRAAAVSLSPSALPCMDLSSLSPSFILPLSLHPLHLPIDAVALKHELEKAGESNLPGEIRFTFSYAHFFFLSLAIFPLYLSFSSIFWGLCCALLLSVHHVCWIFTLTLLQMSINAWTLSELFENACIMFEEQWVNLLLLIQMWQIAENFYLHSSLAKNSLHGFLQVFSFSMRSDREKK